MTRLFGLSHGSKTHTDWRRLFPSQQEYSRVAKDAADCMREGRVYRADLQMCRLDGKLLWVTVTRKAVGPVGEAQDSVWAAVDITPRKELEVALARASSEREAIFNSALVGISFHGDRRIQWVNDKYEEMTGYSRAELVGGTTHEFFADEQDFELEGRKAWASLSRGGVYVDERRLLRRDGKILWAELAGRCVNLQNPDAGLVWTLLDITERHRAEENIRAALEREKSSMNCARDLFP